MTVSASGGPISDEPREMMTPLVAAGVDVHGFPIACCDEHPECSHVYYCVQVYDACHAELSRLRAVLTQQEAAIAWVMGEGDSDFYSEGERKRLGLPTYWWRREFRRRLAGVRSDMAEQRDVQALAATVREGLHILYAYTSDDANPPGQGRSQTHAAVRAALDGLVLEHTRQGTTMADMKAHRAMLMEAAEAVLAFHMPSAPDEEQWEPAMWRLRQVFQMIATLSPPPVASGEDA